MAKHGFGGAAGAILAAALLVGASAPAQAQTYPNRHITIIVPFTAGAVADTVARILAPGLTRHLGQQVIVENVGGAGGTTGVTRASRAAPDGYTIAYASTGTHAGATALYPNLGYHPADSFESIGLVGSTPVAVIARKDLPPKTLKEFIAYLRTNEKTATLAHSGVGSISHIFCAYFQNLIGVRTVAVPYRGLGDSTQALLAGQVDYSCNQAPLTVEHVNTKQLQAYVITSDKRSPMLPDLPTATEAGLPALTLGAWNGLQFPKGTAEPIVKQVNAALSKVLDEPETRQRLESLGIDVATPDRRAPAWFGPFIKSEIARWKPLLEAELAQQKN
jgi:tripartite-type tricarboxylate transporter receptor subunit TctC